MDRVLTLLKRYGWRVLEVRENLVRLHVDPIAIPRATAMLRRQLEDAGCILHKAKPPYALPCAWAEYDVAEMRACIWLVTSDEYLR